MLELVGKYTRAKVMIDDIEKEAYTQIIQMINHPAFTNHVAVMPDTHYGKGSVIGFTMPMTDKVIPNVVGVDIDCGMLMLFFQIEKLNVSRTKLDHLIREAVPFGNEVRERPAYDMERRFPWNKASDLNVKFCNAFNRKFGTKMQPTFYNYKWFEKKCNEIGMDVKRAVNSIGTLGGGK